MKSFSLNLCALLGAVLSVTIIAQAAETPPTRTEVAPLKVETAKIHYKSGKDVNFEELLIQGQLKRPEVSVVTGNVREGADGLLRLRENFLDRASTDAGEEATQ